MNPVVIKLLIDNSLLRFTSIPIRSKSGMDYAMNKNLNFGNYD